MKYLVLNIILLCTLGLTKAQVFNNTFNNYGHIFLNPSSGVSSYNYDSFGDISFYYDNIICAGASTIAETYWGGDTALTYNYIVKLNNNGDTIKTKDFLVDNNEISVYGWYYLYPNNTYISFGYSRKSYYPHLDSTQYLSIIKLDSNFNPINYQFLNFGHKTSLINYITLDNGLSFYTLSNVDIDSSSNREYNIFFSKIDSGGNVLFNYEFGGADWDLGFNLFPLENGNFLISGNTYSYGAGENDIYLFEVDTLGNMLWEQTYGYPGNDKTGSYSLLIDSLKNIYLCGFTELQTGDVAAWLIKTDSVGNMLWEQKYNRGEYFDGFIGMQFSNDGNIVLAGSTHNYDLSNQPATGWLLKIDTTGNIIWERLISKFNMNFSHDYINTIKIDKDEDIFLVGYVTGTPLETNGIYHRNDGWLCKTDSCGFTTGAQPQALLTIDSLKGPNVYISNLSEEYCTAILHLGNGDSLNIYAYSQWTNGANPTQLQYTYTDTGTYPLTLYTYAGDGIDTFTTQVHISDTTTSIKDVIPAEAGISVSLFPNPTKDYVIIELASEMLHSVQQGGGGAVHPPTGGGSQRGVSMHILTPTGQLVQSFTLNPNLLQQRVFLNDLANGVYFVNFTYNNKPFAYKRISVVR